METYGEKSTARKQEPNFTAPTEMRNKHIVLSNDLANEIQSLKNNRLSNYRQSDDRNTEAVGGSQEGVIYENDH